MPRGRPVEDPSQVFRHWSLVREGVERGMSERAAALRVASVGSSASLLRRSYRWVEEARRKDAHVAAFLDAILEGCEGSRGFDSIRNWPKS